MEPWQQLATFAIACIGAGLGVYNTYRARSRENVKLTLRAVSIIQVSGESCIVGNYEPSSPYVGIQVTNLSAFPITVDEVGFELADTDKRSIIHQPQRTSDKPWPCRLEPRQKVTAFTHRRQLAQIANYTYAYAETECGIKKRVKFPR